MTQLFRFILLTSPVVLAMAGCQRDQQRLGIIVLSADETLEPIRDRFNADKERVRVVALFSPV